VTDEFDSTKPMANEAPPAGGPDAETVVEPMLRATPEPASPASPPAHPNTMTIETADASPLPASQASASDPKPELSNATLYGSRSVIGLDIGEQTLKLVHIHAASDGLRLGDATVTSLPPKSDPGRFDLIAKTVADFLTSAKPRVRTACCAMSGEQTATLCCSLPRMGDKDLAQALQWKIAEAASIDADRLIVGHSVVGTGHGGNVDVVAAAVPTGLDRVDALFPRDNPRLSLVITEPLAVENVIRAAYHDQEHGPVAVLDIGGPGAKLTIIGETGLEFTRRLPVGGDAITAALAVKMTLDDQTVQISRQVAERLKKKYAIGQDAPVQSAGITVPATRILGAIRPVLERVASEVVRSLQFYAQTHNQAKVESLLLCGGGATLQGLDQYFTREARIPTTLLDPWRMLGCRVRHGVTVDPALFAVATGAVIHDGSRINLLPPRIRARRMISLVRASSILITAIATCALLGLSWVAHKQSAQLRAMLTEKQASTSPMQAIVDQIAAADAQRAELGRRQEILRLLGVGKPIHAAILKELSNVTPEGAYLRSLSFDDAHGVPEIRLLVDVYSMPGMTATRLKQRLIARLEESPFFVNVSFSPSAVHVDKGLRAPDEALELTCQVLGFPGS